MQVDLIQINRAEVMFIPSLLPFCFFSAELLPRPNSLPLLHPRSIPCIHITTSKPRTYLSSS